MAVLGMLYDFDLFFFRVCARICGSPFALFLVMMMMWWCCSFVRFFVGKFWDFFVLFASIFFLAVNGGEHLNFCSLINSLILLGVCARRFVILCLVSVATVGLTHTQSLEHTFLFQKEPYSVGCATMAEWRRKSLSWSVRMWSSPVIC